MRICQRILQSRKKISTRNNRNSKKKAIKESYKIKDVDYLDYNDDVKKYLKHYLGKAIDKDSTYYKTEKIDLGTKVAAIEPTKGDYAIEEKGLEYDVHLESFVLGANGRISSFDKEINSNVPLVIRGLGTNSQRALKHCIENKRDYYAIDTGYLQPGVSKKYHRVTKNALQNLGPIIDRPIDRLRELNWKYHISKPGKKILVCPPSEKVMKFYEMDLQQWLDETIDEIKTQTNLPIEIRLKPERRVRVTTDTIWQALDSAYCLITFNSIAATEALLYGVPAIALAPNAASVLCNTSIKDIKNLYLPTKHETVAFAKHLSYCQFTAAEMVSGLAWKIVNESS